MSLIKASHFSGMLFFFKSSTNPHERSYLSALENNDAFRRWMFDLKGAERVCNEGGILETTMLRG